MLYALREDGTRGAPDGKGQRAMCPGCEKEVIGHYGQLVAHHWAHPAGRDCDPWSEPEGPWHLGWKSIVKPEQCEVTMKRDGEHHRADIVGDRDIVIELQHSPIAPEVIQERERFYGRMIWVFDASELVGSDRLELAGILDDEPRISVATSGELRGCRRVLVSPSSEDWPFGFGRVSPWESSERLRWKHWRKSWATVTAPLFMDFGRAVGWEKTYPTHLVDDQEGECSIFEVREFREGYLIGRFLDRRDFLRRFLSNSLLDAFASDVQHAVQARADRISRFLLARELYRRQEARRRQEEERRREEARRQEEERRAQRKREAEEERRRYDRARIRATKEQARMEFDDLTMLYRRLTRRGYSTLEGRAEAEAFKETGHPRLEKLKKGARDRLLGEDEGTLRHLLGKVRARLESTNTLVHEMHMEGDLVVVRSQYDDNFRMRARALGLRWNPSRGVWTGSVRVKEAAKRLVDECNKELVRWQFPLLAFLEQTIDEALQAKEYDIEELLTSEERATGPGTLLSPEEWRRQFAEDLV